jgi:transposase InsO family protein
MAEVYLTTEKACALTGLSEGHMRRNARAWHARKSESRSSNGKYPFEFPLSFLPPDAQAKFAEEKRKGLAIVHIPEQTLPLFASVPALQSPPRVAIPEDLEDEARARLKAIEPLLDFRKRTNGSRAEVILSDGHRVKNLQEIAKWIASQQNPPIHPSTIWGWLARFDHGGFASLANRPRKDRGQSRFFEEHTTAAAFLQNKFLKEGLSREMAWEALCRDWRRIGEKGLTPCYDTARNFLNALPEPLKVLAREGKQAHWSKCSPSIIRGKVPVMDWWISDHRQFDVMVHNTVFAELPAGKAFRPWLTLIQDWGSRSIVGFCFAPTPSSRTINSALRLAILGHGMPRNFYWDNGEDYKKVRRDLEAITLSPEASSLLTRDRISFGVTSALPYRPRSKPIESHFSRWSKRFDVLWREAYLGNKPGSCPESTRLAQKHHADFLKGKRADTPLPSDAKFIVATIQWIHEFNEVTRLPALDSRTPSEVMEEAWPERNRPEINPRLLDLLFFERDTRIVMAGGCVQLDGRKYEPTDESLFALDVRQGQKLMIARDPYNLQTAIAAEPDTLQFVGELRLQEFVAQCPNGRITRDQIKAAARRQHSLSRGYADYLAVVSAVVSNQGWKTECEELVERAIARTGTDGRLLPAAVPGALGEPAPARARRAAQPAFISDAVAEDKDFFRGVEAEDDPALPADAVPGALRGADRPVAKKMSSPFVDDAVRDFLADESDPLAKDTES